MDPEVESSEARPLHVAVVSHSSQVAGTERVLLQGARCLIADRGHRFTVFAPLPEGPLIPLLREAGARVEGLDLPWWLAAGGPDHRALTRGLESTLRIAQALEADRPDVVLTLTSVIPWGGIGASLAGIPHAWYLTDFGAAAGENLSWPVAPGDVTAALAAADAILVVSRAVARHYFPTSENRCHLVYPYLDEAEIRARALLPSNLERRRPFQIAMFGALDPVKGPDLALRALGILVRRGVDAELLIVGHDVPALRGRLQEQAEEEGVGDRVRFTGFLDNHYPLMREADAVLVASRLETFSLVALEALLLERPLVATAVGGIPEYVERDRHAWLSPPGDVEGMAAALEAVATRPQEARRRSRTASAELPGLLSRGAFVEALETGLRAAADRGVRTPRGTPLARPYLDTLQASLAAVLDRSASQQVEIASLESRLEQQAGELERRAGSLEVLGRELEESRQQARELQQSLDTEREVVKAQRRELQGLGGELRWARQAADEAAFALAERERLLAQISATRLWRLSTRLWRALDRLLPPGSRRRAIYQRLTGLPARR